MKILTIVFVISMVLAGCSSNKEATVALYFGKSPIQTLADSELASFYKQGEDCLTLNVWSALFQHES